MWNLQTWLMLAGASLSSLFVLLKYLSSGLPTMGPVPSAKSFFEPSTNRHVDFPSIFDAPSLTLSVIVPAYNEEERMPIMLDESLQWLAEQQKKDPSFTYEMIIVDDGSRDNTAQVGWDYVKKYGSDKLRVMQIKPNGGKGHGVMRGMLAARGQYCLFCDADGATKFSDTGVLLAEIRKIEKDGFGVVVGSRNHLVETVVRQRKWYRNVLMHGFHFAVSMLAVRGIRDTQCGFKMFTRKSAQYLFSNQHLPRWGFDVELLFLARHWNMPISEKAVNWTEIPGSKLSVVGATISISKDLLMIRLNYLMHVWRARVPKNLKSS